VRQRPSAVDAAVCPGIDEDDLRVSPQCSVDRS
jgi:hypothetical protein